MKFWFHAPFLITFHCRDLFDQSLLFHISFFPIFDQNNYVKSNFLTSKYVVLFLKMEKIDVEGNLTVMEMEIIFNSHAWAHIM